MGDEPTVEFDWDESSLRHLARHRITRREFEEAMTSDPVFVGFGDERGEDRWYVLVATNNLRVLYLAFTIRGERIRPVTGWDADEKLREAYFRQKSQ